MPIDRVVINASPLIVLFKSGQAELLPQLFNEILIPQAVWEEVTVSKNDIASQQLPAFLGLASLQLPSLPRSLLGIWVQANLLS